MNNRQSILDAGQRIITRKGWAALAINDVLIAAGVPKSSFHQHFDSKEDFGEEMLKTFFADYLSEMDAILSRRGHTGAELLMAYWQHWRETQRPGAGPGRWLTVKIGMEVSDMSEPMRIALKDGTTGIVDRLERVIVAGGMDHSLSTEGSSRATAQSLYDLWIGASVTAKILRDPTPLDNAFMLTSRILHVSNTILEELQAPTDVRFKTSSSVTRTDRPGK